MAQRKRRPQGSGSVRQLPSGRWQAHHLDPDGKRQNAPATFDTKLDAATWLADHAVDEVLDQRADPLLSDYAATWLAGREVNSRPIKPRTRDHYAKILDGRILPSLGTLRLSRITPVKVREWYGQLDATTPTFRAHAYSLLRTIMATALEDDLIDVQPCRIRGGGSTRPRHQTEIASLAELEVITEAMPSRYRTMVLFAAWCGLRFGELTELRRGDVDLGAGVLRVTRGVTRVGGEFIIGDPKSHAGTRTVSIPPHLMPAVADHLNAHVGREPGALLFPAQSGRHLAAGAFQHFWYPARAAAGRSDLRFHDLRHTGATLAAATGATLADLMSRMGHSTPAAALRYQHAAQDRDRAIGEALSGFALAKVVPLLAKAK